MAEWNAGEYNRISRLHAALAEEQLGRLTLQGAERVLNVGCGDGKITAEIAARVPRNSVLGVDPSRNMIAFATGHFGPATGPNLRFEVADVRRLTYREEFDRVISFNALHWVPEQGAALRSMSWSWPEGTERADLLAARREWPGGGGTAARRSGRLRPAGLEAERAVDAGHGGRIQPPLLRQGHRAPLHDRSG